MNTTTIYQSVVHKLVAFRKQEGKTQTEFAEELETTRERLAKIETHKIFPDLYLIRQASKLMGVSIDELCG